MNIPRKSAGFPLRTAAVITPSTGSIYLSKCIESVQVQTYENIEHFVVVDGKRFEQGVKDQQIKPANPRVPVHFITLPHNTGGDGYNGYRICIAFSYLINADVIFFLDDDNWYDPQHISACMSAMNEYEVEWAFTCRSIRRENGAHLVDDNCDSLGFWRRFAAYSGPADYLTQRFIHFYSICPFQVDTSCFAIRTHTLMQFAPRLLHRYHGDAVLASKLVRTLAAACVGERTVNYRLKQPAEEKLKKYYAEGNVSSKKLYNKKFPWLVRQRCEPFLLENLPPD